MKRMLLLAGILVLSGCAALKPERTLQDDNILVSSAYPKLILKINERFKYTGNRHKEGFAGRVADAGGVPVNTKGFLFVNNDKRSGKELLLVRFMTLQGKRVKWASGFNDEGEKQIGKFDINGEPYDTLTFTTRAEDFYGAKRPAQQKSDCVAVKVYKKVQMRYKTLITYIEEFPCASMPKNDSQQNLLAFSQQADRSFHALAQ